MEGVTADHAEIIASDLSNHNAGCDYAWYVVGGEADQG